MKFCQNSLQQKGVLIIYSNSHDSRINKFNFRFDFNSKELLWILIIN